MTAQNQNGIILYPGITSETLLKSSVSWDGVSYNAYPQGRPELSIIKITIPPQTELSWHTHQMPSAAYILSGHLIVEKQSDSSRKIIHTGDTLAEVVETIHRGFTEEESVVLIAFYAGAEGVCIREIIE